MKVYDIRICFDEPFNDNPYDGVVHLEGIKQSTLTDIAKAISFYKKYDKDNSNNYKPCIIIDDIWDSGDFCGS